MLIYDFDFACRVSYAKSEDVCLSYDPWGDIEPTHRHDYYELTYIRNGDGTYIINDIPYTVKKGNLMLITKKDFHSFYSINRLDIINICFIDKLSLNHFPASSVPMLVQLSEDSMNEVEMIIKILEIELNGNKTYRGDIINYGLDTILINFHQNTGTQFEPDHVWNKLISYISNNYATATLEEATKIMNISTSHFCRKFKEQFDTSFITYINRIRIQHAKRFLINTKLTIPEISEQIGYGSNVCRLYEDFKKYTGMTPNQYKKNYFQNK